MKSSETDRTNEGGGYVYTCKKTFTFFILATFFNVFLIFQTFFIFKKTLAKFRAASRLTRSTFKMT